MDYEYTRKGFDDVRADAWQSGARSAQFEHQVLITEDGLEILTQ
jgi:hypothetical protein